MNAYEVTLPSMEGVGKLHWGVPISDRSHRVGEPTRTTLNVYVSWASSKHGKHLAMFFQHFGNNCRHSEPNGAIKSRLTWRDG